jgi:hypothetical protein
LLRPLDAQAPFQERAPFGGASALVRGGHALI